MLAIEGCGCLVMSPGMSYDKLDDIGRQYAVLVRYYHCWLLPLLSLRYHKHCQGFNTLMLNKTGLQLTYIYIYNVLLYITFYVVWYLYNAVPALFMMSVTMTIIR